MQFELHCGKHSLHLFLEIAIVLVSYVCFTKYSGCCFMNIYNCFIYRFMVMQNIIFFKQRFTTIRRPDSTDSTHTCFLHFISFMKSTKLRHSRRPYESTNETYPRYAQKAHSVNNDLQSFNFIDKPIQPTTNTDWTDVLEYGLGNKRCYIL